MSHVCSIMSSLTLVILVFWVLKGMAITLICASWEPNFSAFKQRHQIHHASERFTIIDYISEYIRMGFPRFASASYAVLIDLMGRLGLTISQNKLLPPATQVACLGILIDTVHVTIARPPDKLCDITETVQFWLNKKVASKRQLHPF